MNSQRRCLASDRSCTQRTIPFDPSLPLIGQTARAMAEDLDRCFEAGMLGRVVKPVEREALVRFVRAHARRASADA